MLLSAPNNEGIGRGTFPFLWSLSKGVALDAQRENPTFLNVISWKYEQECWSPLCRTAFELFVPGTILSIQSEIKRWKVRWRDENFFGLKMFQSKSGVISFSGGGGGGGGHKHTPNQPTIPTDTTVARYLAREAARPDQKMQMTWIASLKAY